MKNLKRQQFEITKQRVKIPINNVEVQDGTINQKVYYNIAFYYQIVYVA